MNEFKRRWHEEEGKVSFLEEKVRELVSQINLHQRFLIVAFAPPSETQSVL